LRIEATDEDDLGHWQYRDWSDDARIEIMSITDAPGTSQELKGIKQVIRGIAFADSGIPHGITGLHAITVKVVQRP